MGLSTVMQTALSGMSRITEAVGEYRQALRLRPDYALAHNKPRNNSPI